MALSRKTPLGPGAKSLARGTSFAKPRSTLKPKPRALTRADKAAVAEQHRLALAFERAVKAPKRCACCGRVARHPRIDLDAHHVTPKETLKRLERERRLPPGSLVWDPANGMPLCSDAREQRCHARHTLAVKRVPRSRVPAPALRFAEGLGLTHIIERHYPDNSPVGETRGCD